MNTKRLLLTALVVYILLEVLNYLVHGVILASTYQMEGIKEAFRPEAEMNSMMWITYLVDIVWAFFFAFFFAFFLATGAGIAKSNFECEPVPLTYARCCATRT